MSKKKLNSLEEQVSEKNLSGYVLITCGRPSESGEMQVEMVYKGSTSLASYLLQGAQDMIDLEEEAEEGDSNSCELSLLT